MKIGDLVTSRGEGSARRSRRRPRIPTLNRGLTCAGDVGIVIEVQHPKVKMPDYRTPTAVLVFYGRQYKVEGKMTQEIWFTTGELRLINEG